jgi:hypothetical protein
MRPDNDRNAGLFRTRRIFAVLAASNRSLFAVPANAPRAAAESPYHAAQHRETARRRKEIA